jgi:two-component system response regulator HydG
MDPLPAFHRLVGRSAGMQALFRQIERVAAVDVPVLILGESGTGKELVATALHRLSPRHRARFEPVNCGGLPRELLLSELFGHERGAFTGAVARRAGLLTAAHGGTVFLDEVGELAPEAQAMLLRFLAAGEARAVGATRTSHVDARMIAATHRDLLAAARTGRFREDLYYRLRRVVLRVPALRDRLGDLPLLVEHVRRLANARYRLVIEGVTPAAMRRLAAHPWPGNVRELEAVIEEAMIGRGCGWLKPEDLALDATGPEGDPADMDRANAPLRAGHAERTEVALQLAATRGAVTRRELAAACEISGELARQELVALVGRGLLRRIGAGPRTRCVLP